MNASQHLKELIALSSVSSESNLNVIGYARSWLERNGWQCNERRYADACGVEKANLIARRREEAVTALVCHTDTVPYDSPTMLVPVERDGKIYGRGACDVKAFLACILEVAVDRVADAAIVLTADEEIGCIGARRFVDSGELKTRYAIIGEPTSLRPVRAGKGYCVADVRVQGREAHSAFPALGESAILKAARVLLETEHLQRTLEDDRDATFDPPYTTLNVGSIRGGRAKNVVPGECRFVLEWRPIPGQRPELVPESLRNCECKILRMQPGFATDPDSRLVKTLIHLSGHHAATVSFGTEAPWLAKLGTECVVFGPGTMHVAHGRDEHVPLTELETCANILQDAVAELNAA